MTSINVFSESTDARYHWEALFRYRFYIGLNANVSAHNKNLLYQLSKTIFIRKTKKY